MQQAFWIFPVLYFAAVLVVTSMVIVVLWRIMRAQEATAQALAQAISRLRPPG